jgi:hypothetical protein
VASREGARADELSTWPDTRPGGDGNNIESQRVAGTWFSIWDTAAERRRVAQVHRSAAARLEAEYEQACGTTPTEVISISPLQRYAIGGGPIADGTLLLLSPDAGPPDRLLAAMQCHRAWMMLGRTEIDDCPLDLPGIRVSARGNMHGVELTITVADPALVPELQRRAAHDLEVAQNLSISSH